MNIVVDTCVLVNASASVVFEWSLCVVVYLWPQRHPPTKILEESPVHRLEDLATSPACRISYALRGAIKLDLPPTFGFCPASCEASVSSGARKGGAPHWQKLRRRTPPSASGACGAAVSQPNPGPCRKRKRQGR